MRSGTNRANWKRRQVEQGNGVCHYCQQPLDVYSATIDHKRPLSRNGKDNPTNWVICCRPCNMCKGDMNDHEFLQAMSNQSGEVVVDAVACGGFAVVVRRVGRAFYAAVEDAGRVICKTRAGRRRSAALDAGMREARKIEKILA